MEKRQLAHILGNGYVFNHGIVDNPQKEVYPPHIHESWEILFFLRGNVTYKVEGQNYKLQRGDLILTKPSVFHQILPEDSSLYERYNIVFDGRIIPEEIKKMIPTDVHIFGFKEGTRMFDLFEKAEIYSCYFKGSELSRLVGNIIEEILFNLAIPDGYSTGQTVSNPLVNQAIQYIHNHLTEIKTIDEICEALYITKSHLHHLFNANLGASPKQYITSKKLLKAQKMIRRGKRITEIFEEVGFDDYATFFRNYKKHFGYSPSEELKHESTKEIQA